MGHWFTNDQVEVNAVSDKIGLEIEGIAGHVEAAPAQGLLPIHRAWHPTKRCQRLATSQAAIDALVQGEGYIDQGQLPNCYVHPPGSASGVPLHEIYSPSTGDSVYTTEMNEVIYADVWLGYESKGPFCHVHAQATAGTVALFRLNKLIDVVVPVNLIAVAGDSWPQAWVENLYQGFVDAAAIWHKQGVRLHLNDYLYLPAADADRFQYLQDEDAFHDLLDGYSAPSDGIDVFGVRQVPRNGAGFAPIDGSCDQGGKSSGIAVVCDETSLGQIIAHELGHYLGLEHVCAPGNMMMANVKDAGPDLYREQITKAKQHCRARWL